MHVEDKIKSAHSLILIQPNSLSQDSFQTISKDGLSLSSRHGDAKSRVLHLVRRIKQNEVSTSKFSSLVVNASKVHRGTETKSLREGEPSSHHCLRGSRDEPLSAFGASALQHQSSAWRTHARAKPVLFGTPSQIGLKGPFHYFLREKICSLSETRNYTVRVLACQVFCTRTVFHIAYFSTAMIYFLSFSEL